jgi:hypothetical protein
MRTKKSGDEAAASGTKGNRKKELEWKTSALFYMRRFAHFCAFSGVLSRSIFGDARTYRERVYW